MQDPERITPDLTLAVDYVDHLARYDYARQHVTGRDVLDCGFGPGLPSYQRSGSKRVAGVPGSEEGVAERYH